MVLLLHHSIRKDERKGIINQSIYHNWKQNLFLFEVTCRSKDNEIYFKGDNNIQVGCP